MSCPFPAYSSVRAVLGVSAKELPDAILADELYSSQFRLELLRVEPDIDTYYDAAVLLSTAAALNLVAAAKVFSALIVAEACLSSLPIFSPKSVTDGKAGFSRYADSPYKETVAKVLADKQRYQHVLENAVSVYTSGGEATSVSLSLVGASSPSTDIVTGS